LPRKIKLGGHLRSSDGLRFVPTNARALGYNLVQIMVGEGTSYIPYEFEEEDKDEYRKMMFGIETYVHLPYVINPCEGNLRRRAYYKKSFRDYCREAASLEARAVVIHPGFKKDLTPSEAYNNMLKFFEDSYEENWNLRILLETDSGSKNGSAVGTTKWIYRALNDLDIPNFGLCVDTVHLFARGLNLWEDEKREKFLELYGHLIKLVHLNSPDPEVYLGSFRDRHNTPFEEREDLNSVNLIRDFVAKYPCILERRSLAVQELDKRYIDGLMKPGGEED